MPYEPERNIETPLSLKGFSEIRENQSNLRNRDQTTEAQKGDRTASCISRTHLKDFILTRNIC